MTKGDLALLGAGDTGEQEGSVLPGGALGAGAVKRSCVPMPLPE